MCVNCAKLCPALCGHNPPAPCSASTPSLQQYLPPSNPLKSQSTLVHNSHEHAPPSPLFTISRHCPPAHTCLLSQPLNCDIPIRLHTTLLHPPHPHPSILIHLNALPLPPTSRNTVSKPCSLALTSTPHPLPPQTATL